MIANELNTDSIKSPLVAFDTNINDKIGDHLTNAQIVIKGDDKSLHIFDEESEVTEPFHNTAVPLELDIISDSLYDR